MKMENDVSCDGMIQGETDEIEGTIAKKSRLLRRQTLIQKSKKFCAKEERNATIKKVSVILQKSESDRSLHENQVLQECSEVVDEVQERWRKRDEAKRRLEEYEDSQEVLYQKCQILAQAIAQSRHLVVYTGAGISTAAKIPDYRGPNGIWTRLKEGRDIGDHDLSLAEPTFTHMALFELYRRNILKYVVSQNCDGLHLRSGLPRSVLSEVHGNMYVEVCRNCKPHKEYWRRFDVTENTARFSHKTYRKCYTCNEPLVDSIVHFGERGSLQWPLNWKGACKNARDATTILCLGSSLKVLKKYPWLWQMEKPIKKRPNLYIVNLQWTPKDECANVKLNGKCDVIMKKIMEILGITVPKYDKTRDPIFAHATELTQLERHTTTQSLLSFVKTRKKDTKSDKKDKFYPLDLSVTNNYCDNNSSFEPAKDSITYASDEDSDLLNCTPEINFDDTFTRSKNQLITNSSSKKPFFGNLVDSQSAAALSFLSYNFLHQQMLNRYSQFFFYPYQTSFLYSGLHSIINPLPVITEEISTPKIEFSTVKVEPMCTFCDENYNSLTCMFYPKHESVFSDQTYRYSKLEKRQKPNVCVCCDYTTDEEDYNSDINGSSNVPPGKQRQNTGCACSSSDVSRDNASGANVPARVDSSSDISACNHSRGASNISSACVNCSSSNVPVRVDTGSDISACVNNCRGAPNISLACVNCCSSNVPARVDSGSDISTCVNNFRSAQNILSVCVNCSSSNASAYVNCSSSKVSASVNRGLDASACVNFNSVSDTVSACVNDCSNSSNVLSACVSCNSSNMSACVNCSSSKDSALVNASLDVSACVNNCSSASNVSSACANCGSSSNSSEGVNDSSSKPNASACVISSNNVNGNANDCGGTKCEGVSDKVKTTIEGSNGCVGGNFSNYGRGGKVQPGWFGKGYRKGRRLKRKASTSVM